MSLLDELKNTIKEQTLDFKVLTDRVPVLETELAQAQADSATYWQNAGWAKDKSKKTSWTQAAQRTDVTITNLTQRLQDLYVDVARGEKNFIPVDDLAQTIKNVSWIYWQGSGLPQTPDYSDMIINQTKDFLLSDDKTTFLRVNADQLNKIIQIIVNNVSAEYKKQVTEIQAKADEEARLKAEADAKAKADEEARLKAEADAKAKADEEARLKAEAEAKAKAEQLATSPQVVTTATEVVKQQISQGTPVETAINNVAKETQQIVTTAITGELEIPTPKPEPAKIPTGLIIGGLAIAGILFYAISKRR